MITFCNLGGDFFNFLGGDFFGGDFFGGDFCNLLHRYLKRYHPGYNVLSPPVDLLSQYKQAHDQHEVAKTFFESPFGNEANKVGASKYSHYRNS